MWSMNLSVRCSLHTALTHFWENVANPKMAEVLNLDLPPALPHPVYEITDFDEHVHWDKICCPEIRVSSASIIQHDMTMSESSSSLIAETSTLSAIHALSVTTRKTSLRPGLRPKRRPRTLAGITLRGYRRSNHLLPESPIRRSTSGSSRRLCTCCIHKPRNVDRTTAWITSSGTPPLHSGCTIITDVGKLMACAWRRRMRLWN